jgi:hypothetical protein
MKEYMTLKPGDIVKFPDYSRSMWKGNLFLVVEAYDAYYGDELLNMVRVLSSADGTMHAFNASSLEFVEEK